MFLSNLHVKKTPTTFTPQETKFEKKSPNDNRPLTLMFQEVFIPQSI